MEVWSLSTVIIEKMIPLAKLHTNGWSSNSQSSEKSVELERPLKEDMIATNIGTFHKDGHMIRI